MINLYLNPSSFYRVVKAKVIGSDFKGGGNYVIYTDSQLFYFISKLLFLKIERKSFDFSLKIGVARAIISKSENKKILFFGGSALLMKDAENIFKLNSKYPDNIYLSHGYHNNNLLSLIELIENFKPNVLVVGLGAPLQEEIAIKINSIYPFLEIHTCGAFIEQTGKAKGAYYPLIFEYLSIRWLYRIIKERHVFKRLFFEYPFGVYYMMKLRRILKNEN
jgi:exopolysaccharide biosynthesis WecB/TagA/CpsF family protein